MRAWEAVVVFVGLVCLVAGAFGTATNVLLWRHLDPVARLKHQGLALTLMVIANACLWGARLLQ